MKNIPVKIACPSCREMYERASTPAQRALLGFIVKTGRTADPVYGGAFNLLCDIEDCNGIYILNPQVEGEVANEIGLIAEAAKCGVYKKYKLSNWTILKILMQIRED